MLISIGHENFIQVEHVVTILDPDSSYVKRLIREAEESGRIINATSGRRIDSVLLMRSDHVVLSALRPEAIRRRMEAIKARLKKAGPAQSGHSLDREVLF